MINKPILGGGRSDADATPGSSGLGSRHGGVAAAPSSDPAGLGPTWRAAWDPRGPGARGRGQRAGVGSTRGS